MSTLFQAAVASDPGAFRLNFPEGTVYWSVNGGFIAAAAVSVAEQLSQKPRPISLSGHFWRPVQAGSADASAALLASRRNAELIRVDVSQDGRSCASFHIWCTGPREGPDQRLARAPLVPHPNELRPIEEVLAEGEVLEPFWSAFDQRPINRIDPARMPFADATLLRWMRYRDPPTPPNPFSNARLTLPIVDCMGLPAAFVPKAEPFITALAPTLSLFVNFFEPMASLEWLLCDAHSDYAAEGLIGTRVNVWSSEGRLIAQGLSQMHLRG